MHNVGTWLFYKCVCEYCGSVIVFHIFEYSAKRRCVCTTLAYGYLVSVCVSGVGVSVCVSGVGVLEYSSILLTDTVGALRWHMAVL